MTARASRPQPAQPQPSNAVLAFVRALARKAEAEDCRAVKGSPQ